MNKRLRQNLHPGAWAIVVLISSTCTVVYGMTITTTAVWNLTCLHAVCRTAVCFLIIQGVKCQRSRLVCGAELSVTNCHVRCSLGVCCLSQEVAPISTFCAFSICKPDHHPVGLVTK